MATSKVNLMGKISSLKSYVFGGKNKVLIDRYMGVSGVPVFDPLSISGLEAWYDPSDVSTLTIVDGKVSELRDKANSYHMSQADADERFTYGSLGGLGALQPNARSNNIGGVSIPQANCTIFAVHEQDAGVNTTPDYILGRVTGGCILEVGNSNGNKYGYYSGAGHMLSANNKVGYFVYYWRLVNGVNYPKFKAGDDAINSTLTHTSLVGNAWGRIGDSSYCPTGNIGEILIYNALISDEDANKVANYLKTKWGATWTDL